MSPPAKLLIGAVFASSLWGLPAHAEEPAATANVDLTDAELEKLAGKEAIVIFDERPNKPFDRDTEVRLTGEQLAARGAVDLATALALLPEITVRDAGRGGQNIDIRGARLPDAVLAFSGVEAPPKS